MDDDVNIGLIITFIITLLFLAGMIWLFVLILLRYFDDQASSVAPLEPESVAPSVLQQSQPMSLPVSVAPEVLQQSQSMAPPKSVAPDVLQQSQSMAPPVPEVTSGVAHESQSKAPPVLVAHDVLQQSQSMAPPGSIALDVLQQCQSMTPLMAVAPEVLQQSQPMPTAPPCPYQSSPDHVVLNIDEFSNMDGSVPWKSYECPICLTGDSVQGMKWRVLLPCNHVFHSQCVASWLESQDMCPVCCCWSC